MFSQKITAHLDSKELLVLDKDYSYKKKFLPIENLEML
jgi:hypothetical protein